MALLPIEKRVPFPARPRFGTSERGTICRDCGAEGPRGVAARERRGLPACRSWGEAGSVEEPGLGAGGAAGRRGRLQELPSGVGELELAGLAELGEGVAEALVVDLQGGAQVAASDGGGRVTQVLEDAAVQVGGALAGRGDVQGFQAGGRAVGS